MANATERQDAAPIVTLVGEFVKACQTSVRSDGNTIQWNHLELEGAGRGVR